MLPELYVLPLLAPFSSSSRLIYSGRLVFRTLSPPPAGGKSIDQRPRAFPNRCSHSHRPGVALYTVFGFMAGVSGWLLWSCFMGTCSIAEFIASSMLEHTLTLLLIQASTPTNTLSNPTEISPSVSTANGRDTWSTFSKRSNSYAVLQSSSYPTAKLSLRSRNSNCAMPSAVSSGRWPVSC